MEWIIPIVIINMLCGIPVAVYWRLVRQRNCKAVYPATDYILIINVWWFVVWLWIIMDSYYKERRLEK